MCLSLIPNGDDRVTRASVPTHGLSPRRSLWLGIECPLASADRSDFIKLKEEPY